MAPILVTGATGNVGSAVLRSLTANGEKPASPAVSADRRRAPDNVVAFDFTDPGTWSAAFGGVESMFLMRPPAIGNVRRDLLPAVAAARNAGVRHVVFLSLQGAEKNKVVPHAAVEKWLRSSGLVWTFVRASFFHQNLSTTHAADIRDRDEIIVPAGNGATAFVDAEDVGAVAATALLDPAAHAMKAWTVTGPRALTYDQVADILTNELRRPIRYTRPGLLTIRPPRPRRPRDAVGDGGGHLGDLHHRTPGAGRRGHRRHSYASSDATRSTSPSSPIGNATPGLTAWPPPTRPESGPSTLSDAPVNGLGCAYTEERRSA